MAKDTYQIRINSILGGHSALSHFSGDNQFLSSLGINPARPISDSTSSYLSAQGSGILRPVSITSIGTTVANIMWIESNPKDIYIYAYGYNGSVYTIQGASMGLTALSDGDSMIGSHGNGQAYYDNYMYFSKDTTIARYGPLDGISGAPSFNGDYWVTTLSKTALSDYVLPAINVFGSTGVNMPNHVMHRHSNGKLYFADIVGGQGVLHCISTKKTTYEGDTDDGSTYLALEFGYGLYVTALESYGSNLVIALYEGSTPNASYDNPAYTRGKRAKLAFWDTTSENFNQITWVEFPDTLITALKNVDGVLYIASGQTVLTS